MYDVHVATFQHSVQCRHHHPYYLELLHWSLAELDRSAQEQFWPNINRRKEGVTGIHYVDNNIISLSNVWVDIMY